MKSILAVLIGCIFFSVQAWGPTGHRAIGYVAQDHLSKKSEKAIQQLLGHETLAEVSTWMDEVRSDERYDEMYTWHWVTVPDNKTYLETEKNPSGDLISALNNSITELSNKSNSDSVRAHHLKIIVHLVGDFHQPLHVGTGEDQGGNRREVNWFGKKSNLHRVWDSQMIESQLYSYTELAASLPDISKSKVKEWQSASFEDWVAEAQALRVLVYDIPENNRLSYEYRYRTWATVELQLVKSGVRLAGILNKAFN